MQKNKVNKQEEKKALSDIEREQKKAESKYLPPQERLKDSPRISRLTLSQTRPSGLEKG